MYGLSNGTNIFDLRLLSRVNLRVRGQGQTLKTLKSNISVTKRYEIERKCQWKLDRKLCMGFRMAKIFLTSRDL